MRNSVFDVININVFGLLLLNNRTVNLQCLVFLIIGAFCPLRHYHLQQMVILALQAILLGTVCVEDGYNMDSHVILTI